MTLASFNNTLQMALRDGVLMTNPNSYKVVNDLVAMTQSVQNLTAQVMSSNTGDALSMMLMEKVREVENIIATFGPQRLAAIGFNAGAPNMMPFGTAPMQNQSFQYPTMGQQAPMMQPPFPQQHMQPPMPQPQMQQHMAPPAPPMPPAAPPPAPMPEAAPVAPTPAPAPVAAPAPPPAPAPAAEAPAAPAGGGGGGPSVFMGLPGMGGGADDKPAAGRDYILKVLQGK